MTRSFSCKTPDDFTRLHGVMSRDTKGPWKVEIREDRPTRSDAQNRALWAVAYPPLMEHMGLRGERDREDLHTFMLGEYFGWHSYDLLGKKKQRPVRTTTRNADGKREVISVTEFMDFFAFIQQRAAEHGVFIPDPDPAWFMKQEAA